MESRWTKDKLTFIAINELDCFQENLKYQGEIPEDLAVSFF